MDRARRYGLFLIGLFIASMGVAFSAKAGLGTSPVASVPYSVSLVSSLFTFGGWLNILSVIQITAQVLVMKGKCNYIEIAIQTVASARAMSSSGFSTPRSSSTVMPKTCAMFAQVSP